MFCIRNHRPDAVDWRCRATRDTGSSGNSSEGSGLERVERVQEDPIHPEQGDGEIKKAAVGAAVTVQHRLWQVGGPQRRQAGKVHQHYMALFSKTPGRPYMEDREVQEELRAEAQDVK